MNACGFEMHADPREGVRGLSLLLPLISDDSLTSFFFVLLEAFTLTPSASVHLIEEVGKRSPTVFPLCSPFLPLFFPPSSLSICPLVCLICSLPEGGTIFWMSPMLINWCQRPPCRAYSCSEWQIILCHGESVWEEEESRGEEGEREMLAACPSLLVASVIATASHLHRSTSEKVWHLGGYVFQILLERHMCGHKHTCRERECVPTVRYTYRLKPILWKNFPKTN